VRCDASRYARVCARNDVTDVKQRMPMDVMVEWDQTTSAEGSFARVSAVASAASLEHPTREVVTLYGVPTPESLALALAAAVEARKAGEATPLATRDLRVSTADGAVGDAAWHDRSTGEIIKRELSIPLTVLRETAAELLAEGEQGIRRLLAGLLMPEWPEGTRRALTLQVATAGAATSDVTLAQLREADADNFRDDE
jgi:hypothetical protein